MSEVKIPVLTSTDGFTFVLDATGSLSTRGETQARTIAARYGLTYTPPQSGAES